jgi:hypothetical protein
MLCLSLLFVAVKANIDTSIDKKYDAHHFCGLWKIMRLWGTAGL